MKATPQQKEYANSRTIQQTRWHGYELSWFIEKMDWQVGLVGIPALPVKVATDTTRQGAGSGTCLIGNARTASPSWCGNIA